MNTLQWNPRHYLLAYAGDDEGPRHTPAGECWAFEGYRMGTVLVDPQAPWGEFEP